MALYPFHFNPVIECGLQFGKVFATEGKPKGAAVRLPPGCTNVTEERATAAVLDRIAQHIGDAAAGRFLSVLEFLDPYHNNDMPEPHWYVMVVGVEPIAGGQGLGRRLFEPMLDSAQRTAHSCCLETAQPQNVPFYEHLGFKLIRSIKEPVSGLDLWTFRWDAASLQFHRRARQNGLAVPDLEVTFYGMTEFRVEDPDGNRLWIGQDRRTPGNA